MHIARVKLTIGDVTFETDDRVTTPDGAGSVLSADPFADQEILVRLASGRLRWYSWCDVAHMTGDEHA